MLMGDTATGTTNRLDRTRITRVKLARNPGGCQQHSSLRQRVVIRRRLGDSRYDLEAQEYRRVVGSQDSRRIQAPHSHGRSWCN